MTIQTIQYRGVNVDISLDAKKTTVDGYFSSSEISKKLALTGNSYYLEVENVLVSDRKAAVSLEAQLMSWVGEIDISETNDWIVLVPFDKLIYVAFLDAAENYVRVTKERLISFSELGDLRAEANAELHLNYEILLLRGGKLTDEVVASRISGLAADTETGEAIELFVLPSSKAEKYTLKKKTDFVKIVVPFALIFALLALAWIYQTYEPAKTEKTPLPPPKAARDIGYQIEALAYRLQDANKLILHGIAQVTVVSDSLAYLGRFEAGRTDYNRLREIAASMNAKLDIRGSVWRIYQIGLEYERQLETDLHPIDQSVKSVVELDSKFPVTTVIGTARDLKRYIVRSDKTSASNVGIDANMLLDYSNSYKQKPILGKLVKAAISRGSEGMWNGLTLNMDIKGRK